MLSCTAKNQEKHTLSRFCKLQHKKLGRETYRLQDRIFLFYIILLELLNSGLLCRLFPGAN